MSERLITLKLKSRSGQVNDIQVSEILEIDGVPYTPGGDVEALRSHVIHMDGRLTALERVIGQSNEGE